MREIDYTKPRSIKDKTKAIFSVKTPVYKTWWLYLVIIALFVLLVFVVPVIINELYKAGDGYITLWDASDVLAFYAVILSGIISISTVIVTVHYSKKSTDRQISFSMGQTKTPFFILDRVSQKDSKKYFDCNGHRQWSKSYTVLESGKLSEEGIIEITARNIGDGIALAPSYQVDMIASTIIPDNIVLNNKYILLSFDLMRNLNEKYVLPHFIDGFAKLNTGTVVHYTRIFLYYQNTLGIKLQQEILIELGFDFSRKQVVLTVNELSPQKVLV